MKAGTRVASAVFVALVIAGCAPPVSPTGTPTPATPLGCWRFAFTPWSPPLSEDTYPLPVVLELTDTASFGSYRLALRHVSSPETTIVRLPASMIADVRRVIGDSLWRPDSVVATRELQAFWEPRAGDSVAVVLPTHPLTGIRLDLHLRGDSLRGRGSVQIDESTAPSPMSTVRAVRATCPRS